jgi:hypothetical protein
VQVCVALSQVAKHSLDLAEAVVEADVFPKALICLRFPDEGVRIAAAALVRDVVKHSAELAQMIVGAGGVSSLVESIEVWHCSLCLLSGTRCAYMARQQLGHSAQQSVWSRTPSVLQACHQ